MSPPKFSGPNAARRGVHRAAAVLLMLSGSLSANAGVIGLYSTGVDDDGILLTPGTIDPHYSVISAPAGTGSDVLTQLKLPFWKGPPAGSNWVSVVDDGSTGIPPGDYVFRTTFEITAADPSQVVLTGSWMVDNEAEIFLNGQSTGVSIPFGLAAHQEIHDFVINDSNANFLSGTNTLELRWNNTPPGNSPGGIAMNISGSVVPEPSSFAFLGLIGLAGAVSYRQRRRPSSKA